MWLTRQKNKAQGGGAGHASADSLMARLGVLVFVSEGNGVYRRVTPAAPEWLTLFTPNVKAVEDARDLPFDFLAAFLVACDEAVKTAAPWPELDEIWHERDQKDVEHSFQVQLVDLGGTAHVVVQCLDRTFDQKQTVFQQARDQKLTLDALARTEAELRESQQRLKLMMRQAPAVFWCTDSAGLLTYCSGSALEAFARGSESSVGLSVRQLFGSADVSSELVSSAHEIALMGESATFSVNCGLRSFDVRVEPLHDGEGIDPVGAIGVGVESTERVKAEKGAAEALQAKTDFVTGISHEIRTPMNAIIGLTELALDLPLNAEQETYLNSSVHSAESLLGIIDQLLDFSKLEQSESVLDKSEFSVIDLIDDVLGGLAVHAHGKGVELVPVVGGDVPEFVVGDAGRLQQILVNLVGNAIKFTPEGNIQVGVSREPAVGGKSSEMLHFVVTDTGIGVLPETQELIFDAFRQAEPGIIRKYGGTGLGLAIASELTRLLGGRIWVVSPAASGVGSSFHFTVSLEFISQPEKLPLAALSEEKMPSSCLLVGVEGAALSNARDILVSLFGDIAEIKVPLDGRDRISIPFADVSGVLVLDVPANRKDRERMLSVLEGVDTCGSRVIAVCPVGLPPQEMNQLRSLCHTVVLKPLKSDLLHSLVSPSGFCLPDGASFMKESERLRILIAEDDELSQWVLASICRSRGHEVALVSKGEDAISLTKRRGFDVLLLDIQLPHVSGRLSVTRRQVAYLSSH